MAFILPEQLQGQPPGHRSPVQAALLPDAMPATTGHMPSPHSQVYETSLSTDLLPPQFVTPLICYIFLAPGRIPEMRRVQHEPGYQ